MSAATVLCVISANVAGSVIVVVSVIVRMHIVSVVAGVSDTIVIVVHNIVTTAAIVVNVTTIDVVIIIIKSIELFPNFSLPDDAH